MIYLLIGLGIILGYLVTKILVNIVYAFYLIIKKTKNEKKHF